MYVCLKKYLVSKLDIDTMAVRATYIKTVEDAYKSDGEQSLDAFFKTTEDIPKKYVSLAHNVSSASKAIILIFSLHVDIINPYHICTYELPGLPGAFLGQEDK